MSRGTSYNLHLDEEHGAPVVCGGLHGYLGGGYVAIYSGLDSFTLHFNSLDEMRRVGDEVRAHADWLQEEREELARGEATVTHTGTVQVPG